MNEKKDLPTTTAEEATTLAERMNLALKRAGKSKIELARACHISHPSVSSWCNGRTKSLKGATVLAAAQFLGVSPDWLGRGIGSMEPQTGADTLVPDAPYSSIKSDAVRQILIAMSQTLLEQTGVAPEDCRPVKVEWDDMAPLIKSGDQVLVDISPEGKKIAPSKIYALQLAGDDSVRIMRMSKFIDGTFKIWGDNPQSSKEMLFSAENAGKLQILGRVIARLGPATL